MSPRMTAAELQDAAQPRRRKPRDLEGPIHREVLAYLRRRFPRAIVHHSANSIARSGLSIARQIHANTLMGTVKGFPDLICLMPGGVAWLFEVKAKGNSPDKDQRDLHEQLQRLGFRVAVVRSTADVEAVINGWAEEGGSMVHSHPVTGTTGAKRRKQ